MQNYLICFWKYEHYFQNYFQRLLYNLPQLFIFQVHTNIHTYKYTYIPNIQTYIHTPSFEGSLITPQASLNTYKVNISLVTLLVCLILKLIILENPEDKSQYKHIHHLFIIREFLVTCTWTYFSINFLQLLNSNLIHWVLWIFLT